MATVLVLSGVSTRATLDEFAYRPSVVLDGVGDIPRLAQRGGGEGAERSEADAVFPDITHHGNSVSAPLDQCCPIKPFPQRGRLSKRTADRRQKGKTEHRPGRKQSRAVLFLSKENTAFKRERARAVSRRRCRASKSFVCVG